MPRSSSRRHVLDGWLAHEPRARQYKATFIPAEPVTQFLAPSEVSWGDEEMSSSDQNPAATPASSGPAEPSPPGRPTAVSSRVLDMGAQLAQALKPVRQMKQHACSFALYAHDLHRQVEVHHFVARLNQDVLQCAVYDSDKPSARLI
ncbi:hypothetical protein ACJX0J_035466, partial [Zea mays]